MTERVAANEKLALKLGEVASTAGVLALAAVLLFLLVTSVDGVRDTELGPNAPALRTGPAADFRGFSPPAAEPMMLIVIGEPRAAELRDLLLKERELRTLLDEPPRRVEVIVAVDETAAESIQAAFFEQSALPGVQSVQAVVIGNR